MSGSPAVELYTESVPLVSPKPYELRSLEALPANLTGFQGTRDRRHPGLCLAGDGHWPTAGSTGIEFVQGRHKAPVTGIKDNCFHFRLKRFNELKTNKEQYGIKVILDGYHLNGYTC